MSWGISSLVRAGGPNGIDGGRIGASDDGGCSGWNMVLRFAINEPVNVQKQFNKAKKRDVIFCEFLRS
jgi:hypothetical protein